MSASGFVIVMSLCSTEASSCEHVSVDSHRFADLGSCTAALLRESAGRQLSTARGRIVAGCQSLTDLCPTVRWHNGPSHRGSRPLQVRLDSGGTRGVDQQLRQLCAPLLICPSADCC